MEDKIADALKDYDELDQGKIEKALIDLTLRGVYVDRCENKHQLQFVQSGKSTDFRSLAFSRRDNGIPSFERFHEQASKYLGAFKVQYFDAANTCQSVDARFIGKSSPKVYVLDAAPTEYAHKPDKCEFVSPVSDHSSIEDFANHHIPDSNKVIVLRGRSKWILNRLSRNLAKEGYGSVTVEYRSVKFAWHTWANYQLGQLMKATFTHKHIANFLWGAVGLSLGFILRQITL